MDPALLGILAAFATALLQSVTDLGTKAATRDAETPLILMTQWSVGAVVLTALLLFFNPQLIAHPLDGLAAMVKPGFFALLALSGVLNIVAYYFFIRAFQLSDASLVAPLALLTPVLMLATSPLIVDEQAPLAGIAGVLLTVGGATLLAATEPGASKRASLATFARDPGARSMATTAAIWSVTANIDKLGGRASTPLLWITALTIFIALCATVFYLATRRRAPRLAEIRYACLAGGANAIGNALQMFAVMLLLTPYVIAIKRMSALFTVALSALLLKENIRGRILGALVMLAGAALIAAAR